MSAHSDLWLDDPITVTTTERQLVELARGAGINSPEFVGMIFAARFRSIAASTQPTTGSLADAKLKLAWSARATGPDALRYLREAIVHVVEALETTDGEGQR